MGAGARTCVRSYVALQPAKCESAKLRDCSILEVEPKATACSTARSSQPSDGSMEAMGSEVDGLEAAGSFVEISEVSEGSKVVSSKWLYMWKGDTHGTIEIAKARSVAMGYSEVKGDGYFETFVPTVSATSNRLIATLE